MVKNLLRVTFIFALLCTVPCAFSQGSDTRAAGGVSDSAAIKGPGSEEGGVVVDEPSDDGELIEGDTVDDGELVEGDDEPEGE